VATCHCSSTVFVIAEGIQSECPKRLTLLVVPGNIIRAVEDRFFEKVEWVDKWHDRDGVRTRCLEWTGCCTNGPKGRGRYGRFAVVASHPQKWVTSHRWLYERWVGPVPLGLELDHLCRNSLCCNPAHLEAVTPTVNVRRSRRWPRVTEHQNTCGNGHRLSPENTYKKVGRPSPACLQCRRDASARHREKLRSARAAQGPTPPPMTERGAMTYNELFGISSR
jgi:hypothetical protein